MIKFDHLITIGLFLAVGLKYFVIILNLIKISFENLILEI